MEELAPAWLNYLERLDIAFQPIVSIHSGKLYGVEALLRGVESIGFDSIDAFFDQAYLADVLYTFDLALREKVFEKFTRISNHGDIKLFVNLDNRLLEMPDFSGGNTARLLKKYNLLREMICFEISERHEIADVHLFEEMLNHYRQEHYSIAVDDFGIGVSGYKMLYQSTPDIIKIDRFFLGSICRDLKKKILVRSIVQLATQLGITVIAEGVETETEMLVCKELGCHLLQGYFVQRPTLETDAIEPVYEQVGLAGRNDRRTPSNKSHIQHHLDLTEPICTHDAMSTVLQRLRENRNRAIPVVGSDRVPLGILDEERVMELVSSPYGHSILMNESAKAPKVQRYIQKCAMADIHTGMEQLVECFANYKEAKGMIITENMEYYGFLSAADIVGIINERNLASARDQNPLTKLPGNRQIDSYISDAIAHGGNVLFCYFDLNNFKAYNDSYGFRNGDRVIQLFADILHKEVPRGCFKGHIGGDDFFVGVKLDNRSFDEAVDAIKDALERFRRDAADFYNPADRERGYIVAKDRDGVQRSFDLLSASAVVVQLHEYSRRRSMGLIHKHFAIQKKVAKASAGYINISTIL